jgi:general secretion pathway protein A
MYQAYWGLNRSPFSTDAVRQALADSPVHAEALARLDFLLEGGSRFGLLFGPAGSGKSLVLLEFARKAARGGAAVALVSTAAAEIEALLDRLAIAWHAAPRSREAPELWRAVVDRLEEMRMEGVSAIAVLDDLDLATPAAQSIVERLLALTDVSLTIVAAARHQTASRINGRLLEQADLRIDLAPWSEDETRAYLHARLAHAGRKQPAFDDSAVHRLFELSGGAPRHVNRLAQLALLAGAGQSLLQIDAETIDAVQDELSVRQ